MCSWMVASHKCRGPKPGRRRPGWARDFSTHRRTSTNTSTPARSEEDTMRLGLQVLSLSTILFGAYGVALNDAHPQAARDNTTTPLILENSEGEHRVRKPREIPIPTGPFTIKVDRKNGGSQKMWLGTEEIPSGGVIQRHKHLGQDEILLIQTGSAHVWLGTQERDVYAGAIVFIPFDSWVSLYNICHY